MIGLEFVINADVGGRGIWEVFIEYVKRRPNFLEKASKLLLENFDSPLIITGFPIPPLGIGETDGPLGAYSLYLAIEELGGKPEIIADPSTSKAMKSLGVRIADEGRARGKSLIIAVESPGASKDGKHYNMRGIEIKFEGFDHVISEATKLGIKSIGIGDGGNEIGMGNVIDLVEKYIPLGERIASKTRVDVLITSGVSNWGAYALIAGTSKIEGKDLLRGFDQREALREIVEGGLIDGVTKRGEMSVDGIGIEFHERMLSLIRAFYLYRYFLERLHIKCCIISL